MTETTRLEELQRRVQRDPASISFAALAEEYRRLGQFEDAIATCRAGLQRHPSYLSARVTLGRALLEIGDYENATVELEHVLRSAPENLAAIRALAEIHRRRGEMPEAFEHYQETLASAEAVPEPAAPPPPSRIEPIAVQSTVVKSFVPSPSLARLEAFLAAIQRARRDVLVHAAR
jgi:tetratricopeptide (TPR) repeat protein